MIRCNSCGSMNNDGSRFCASCGTRITAASYPPPHAQQANPYTTAPPQDTANKYSNQQRPSATVNNYVASAGTNGMGLVGFIIALIGLFLSWIPILGWIIWFVGTLFSIIGLFRNPKGLAIAGTIISFVDLIIALGVTLIALGLLASYEGFFQI